MRLFVRKWLIPCILVLLVFVTLLEVAIRFLGIASHLYTEPALEYSPHGDYWRYQAGFEGRLLGPTPVRIGPRGNRLHGATASAAGHVITVAIFGDSVTFGQACEEEQTFASVLEQKLRGRGLPVEVLNFGVQGHTLEMELAHLIDRSGEILPEIVVLAFLSDDLNQTRGKNHVDRFGYLTKDRFGPPSLWLDYIRSLLRHSHTALILKEAYLRMWAHKRSTGISDSSAIRGVDENRLERARNTFAKFERVLPSASRIIVCLDMRETPLTRGIKHLMETEFSDLTYVHSPEAFAGLQLDELRVPRDGHPNARAHRIYAELLELPIRDAIQSRSSSPDQDMRSSRVPR